MNLHEYTIIGHNRSEIGRWMGALSIIAAPLITQGLLWLSQLPFLTSIIHEKIAIFTISTGSVYLCLYWLFNKYGWQLLDSCLHIPNLNGKWQLTGLTKSLDGTTSHEWKGELTITQKWDRIAIELKTGQSSSYSETASILVKHDGECKLSYSYQNHPHVGEPELQKHQGFCELIFDVSGKKAEGHYFNSLGRYTFGQMKLTKIK